MERRPPDAAPFVFPQSCPACGEPVRRLAGESAWRCVNVSCPAVARESIVHFVSKAGLDIQGVGRKWVRQLAEDGAIRSPADLFRLTPDVLLRYERMGERSAANFVEALDKARREASLPRLICALGIRHVGEQTARTLAAAYADLDALAGADEQVLQLLPDIGPEVASAIVAFFSDAANRELLRAFRAIGLWPVREAASKDAPAGPLGGKRLLFTGVLSMPRAQAQKLAQAAGAELAGSVGKNLDFLVVGHSPGSKLDKAEKLGIKVLTEAEFIEMARTTA